jgi:hypothetical protein
MNNFVRARKPRASSPRLSRPPWNVISREDGVALLAAMLLTVLLAALASAMAASGMVESVTVRNHQRWSEARAAAEAGLSHALELTVRRLNEWNANGFPNQSAAVTALLRGPDNAIDPTATHAANDDNGSLEALDGAGETELPRFPASVAIANMPGASYRARLLDEDDATRNLTLLDRVRVGENGQPLADGNRRIVIQVTGVASDNTTVILETVVSPRSTPAIVSDQSVTINGNPSIVGDWGGIHSNANLTLTGNPTVTRDATATSTFTSTGTPTIGGMAAGGQPLIPIPAVNAWTRRADADFVLTVGNAAVGGRVHGPFNPDGTLGPMLCNAFGNNQNCQAAYGWEYDPGNSGWKVSGNDLLNGTYYVRGNVTISGNPGNSGLPKVLTVLAEGNIEVSGTPRLTPDTPGLMFVTDRDLKLNGNMEMAGAIEGAILVGEQMEISGNPILFGYIWIDNASNVSNLVISTAISGNPTITYNGGSGANTFEVSGWREIR